MIFLDVCKLKDAQSLHSQVAIVSTLSEKRREIAAMPIILAPSQGEVKKLASSWNRILLDPQITNASSSTNNTDLPNQDDVPEMPERKAENYTNAKYYTS